MWDLNVCVDCFVSFANWRIFFFFAKFGWKMQNYSFFFSQFSTSVAFSFTKLHALDIQVIICLFVNAELRMSISKHILSSHNRRNECMSRWMKENFVPRNAFHQISYYVRVHRTWILTNVFADIINAARHLYARSIGYSFNWKLYENESNPVRNYEWRALAYCEWVSQ